MNTTIITGNIAQDATVRTNPNNDSSISFGVAVNKKWKNQAGEIKEETTWFDCTIWRKPEKTSIANYLKKGTFVTVQGEVSTRAYANKDGDPVARLCLKVEDIVFNNPGQHTSTAQVNPPAQPAFNAPQAQEEQIQDLPF